MAADWYPSRLDDRDSWHVSFKTQAAATGTTHGLAAGDVTQASDDSILVGLCAEYDVQLRDYVEAWTQWRNAVLDGDPNAVFPNPPTPPVLDLGETAFKPGVQARTRQFAGVIKADAQYSPAVGEDYGIVGTAPILQTPAISSATAIPGTSNIALAISKGGHGLVAVDMRRGGGAWNELIRTQTAAYTDTTAPLVAGQPETREFRCQGVADNVRVGDLSATVSAVTSP